jgi:hypothetical protein
MVIDGESGEEFDGPAVKAAGPPVIEHLTS